ncbi:hypothetical protein KAR91_49060, partial [Candidatus Pacearchaeota archaeon]|nr:hypothetical protein [Candidatus Pacearchaeota archaeon]
MRTYVIVLLICLMGAACMAQTPPPTRRFLLEADDADTSVVTAKSPNTAIGFQSHVYLWLWSIYTGTGIYATFDTSDVAVDGDVLTYNSAGNTFDFQQPPGAAGGETNTLSDTGTFLADSGFGLAQTKSGVDLRIRGLIEGSNVTITQRGDTGLQIDASGGADGNDTLWSLRTNRDSLIYVFDDNDTALILDIGDTTILRATTSVLMLSSDASNIEVDAGGSINEIGGLFGQRAGDNLWLSALAGGETRLNISNASGSKVGIYDNLTETFYFESDSLVGAAG